MTEPTRCTCPDRLAVSPTEAARIAGVGRTKLYEALGSGNLRSLKIGKRRLILIDSLRSWLDQHALNGANARVERQSDLPTRGTKPRHPVIRYKTTVSPHGKDK